MLRPLTLGDNGPDCGSNGRGGTSNEGNGPLIRVANSNKDATKTGDDGADNAAYFIGVHG